MEDLLIEPDMALDWPPAAAELLAQLRQEVAELRSEVARLRRENLELRQQAGLDGVRQMFAAVVHGASNPQQGRLRLSVVFAKPQAAAGICVAITGRR